MENNEETDWDALFADAEATVQDANKTRKFETITEGVWQVNKEKTFEQILEKIKITKPERVEELLAEKEENIDKIRQYILFFRANDLTYRLTSKEYSEEGSFQMLTDEEVMLINDKNGDETKCHISYFQGSYSCLLVDWGDPHKYILEKLTTL